MLSLSLFPVLLTAAAAPLHPVVEAEEVVYDYDPADNGAGPLWCYGSTCLARQGEQVFVSGLETIPGAKPLNNCRWVLFRRGKEGWESLQKDAVDRQREPCPLGIFPDGRLLLSVNPTRTAPDTYNGTSEPHLLQFAVDRPQAPAEALRPVWEGRPAFTEHSYRGLGVDAANREIVLLNNVGYEEQHWTFRDRGGKWSRHGILHYPIRGCYPEVALRNRACHILAVGDVVEPVEEWRKWKHEQSGREWDYVFRRLFYVSTPDIVASPLHAPVEIDNVDATGGHLANYDVWIDREGAAHLLYRKTSVASAGLRDRFLPGVPIVTSLEHCIVRDNKVIVRDTLTIGGEGKGGEIPGWARLHATEDGRLFVFYHCRGTDAAGKSINENRLMEILPGGKHSPPVTVATKHPLNFMTATERGGSAPSHILDVLGSCDGRKGICYARIRLP